jgi:broad specificity phosphatase PhoE
MATKSLSSLKNKNSSTETILYFVRHGDVYNPSNIIYGSKPFGLSVLGKKQISKTAKWLCSKKISKLYSSPLFRTIETSNLILNQFPSLKITKHRGLLEWIRPWTGKSLEAIKNTKEWQVYQNTPTKLTGYLTLKGLSKRISSACMDIVKKNQGKEIVCVSHQDVIRALRLKLENKNLDILNKYPCTNGSILIVHFKGLKFKKLTYVDLS